MAADAITAATLPVSGIAVSIRQATGDDDVLLLEGGDDATVACSLATAVTTAADGRAVGWPELTPTDLDALVLRLRQAWIGDRITAELHCRATGCGQRIDVAFGIEAFLAFHRPKPARGRGWTSRTCHDQPGWFVLAGGPDQETRFRLPRVADQIAAAGAPDPEAALAHACMDEKRIGRRQIARVERALAMIAPALSTAIEARCTDCGASVPATFDPRSYCLRELRDRARFVYEDVDLLATRYHWPERGILAMPNPRRRSYVELALARAA